MNCPQGKGRFVNRPYEAGSHGKLFLPWVLIWEKQKPTAQKSCRGYQYRQALWQNRRPRMATEDSDEWLFDTLRAVSEVEPRVASQEPRSRRFT